MTIFINLAAAVFSLQPINEQRLLEISDFLKLEFQFTLIACSFTTNFERIFKPHIIFAEIRKISV